MERKGSNFAAPTPLPWRNPRKGRDQILLSGNTEGEKQRLPRVGVFGGSFFCLISNSDGFLSRSVSHKILSLSLNAAAEVVRDLDAPRRQNVGRRAMTLENFSISFKDHTTQDIFTFFSFSSEQIFKTTLLKGSVILTWHSIPTALRRPVRCAAVRREPDETTTNRITMSRN